MVCTVNEDARRGLRRILSDMILLLFVTSAFINNQKASPVAHRMATATPRATARSTVGYSLSTRARSAMTVFYVINEGGICLAEARHAILKVLNRA